MEGQRPIPLHFRLVRHVQPKSIVKHSEQFIPLSEFYYEPVNGTNPALFFITEGRKFVIPCLCFFVSLTIAVISFAVFVLILGDCGILVYAFLCKTCDDLHLADLFLYLRINRRCIGRNLTSHFACRDIRHLSTIRLLNAVRNRFFMFSSRGAGISQCGRPLSYLTLHCQPLLLYESLNARTFRCTCFHSHRI